MDNSFSNYLKTTDGEQIFYQINFLPEKLNENVLIFNYGLVCSHHHWQHQIDYFDSLGFPILLYDYRGHFKSSGADNISNITFERMTDDLKELIDSLNLKSSILLGHSMGVNICLEYAKRFPSVYPDYIIENIQPNEIAITLEKAISEFKAGDSVNG